MGTGLEWTCSRTQNPVGRLFQRHILAPTLGQRLQTGQPQLSWNNSIGVGELSSKSWSLVHDLLVLVDILYFFESFAMMDFALSTRFSLES